MAPDDPSQYLIGLLQDAFAHDERVSELNIDVEVVDEEVVLFGTVTTRERRDALTEVAKELCPDRTVHNRVTVIDLSEAPSAEELA